MLRMMGQSEYGLYSMVVSVVGALLLLDCGFGSALVRYIVKYKVSKEPHVYKGMRHYQSMITYPN